MSGNKTCAQRNLCKVMLTRGNRAKMMCGRPTCAQDDHLCLNHWRMRALHGAGPYPQPYAVSYSWPEMPQECVPTPELVGQPLYQNPPEEIKILPEACSDSLRFSEEEFIEYVRKHSSETKKPDAPTVQTVQDVPEQHENL